MSSDTNAVRVTKESLRNTKITSNAIAEQAERLSQRRDARRPKGMAISETEALMLLLGYDQICTNIKFVHVSTIPMEERLAYDCSKSVESFQRNQWRADQSSDLNSHDIIPIVVVRRELGPPDWRQLSSSQEIVVKDQLLSPLSIDPTTIFSVRAPELQFVMHQRKFFVGSRDTWTVQKQRSWMRSYCIADNK